MEFYHIDLFNKLSDANNTIKSITDYSELDEYSKKFCRENFPEGIGYFGFEHMKSLSIKNKDIFEFSKEMFLEYIRQIKAPSKVSRLQCIFAIKDFEDVRCWKKSLLLYYKNKGTNLGNPYVYVLEDSSNVCFETDTYWRDYVMTDTGYWEIFNIAYEYYNGCNYWSGKKAPNLIYSLPEVLVKLPAKFVKKLKYEDFLKEYI